MLHENTVIPGNTEMVVPMRIVNSENHDLLITSNFSGIFEPYDREDEFDMVVCSCTATVSNNSVIPVLVMNLHDYDVTLFENTVMGKYYSTNNKFGEVYEIIDTTVSEVFEKQQTMPDQYQKGKPYPPIDLTNVDLCGDEKIELEKFI